MAYPIFHSAVALDDALSKKDFKGAQAEYTAELQLYSDDQSKSQGLVDTLQLAQAYSQPGATQDLPKACYLYARVWDFAPPQYKAQIEPKLTYYYKKYHGGMDGLDQLKERGEEGQIASGYDQRHHQAGQDPGRADSRPDREHARSEYPGAG